MNLLTYRKSLWFQLNLLKNWTSFNRKQQCKLLVIRNFCSNNQNNDNAGSNPLLKELINQIKFSGPITVNDYMRLSLIHPKHGFYMKQDVFGQKGHFITSPEISPLFGEMVSIWIMHNWESFSRGLPLDLIELGPGRGTLALDIARSMTLFSKNHQNVDFHIHMVEISPHLRIIQQKNLCGKILESNVEQNDEILHSKTIFNQPITWYQTLEQIPRNDSRFKVFVSNEFFDAFPIHKFIRDQSTKNEWRELLIDFDDRTQQLRWIKAKNDTPMTKLLKTKSYFSSYSDDIDHLEFSPQTLVTIGKIVDRLIDSDGRGIGCLLICDYGYDDLIDNKPINRDTFRAYKHHGQCDPLKDPGMADLTADVDFGTIRRSLKGRKQKCQCFGTVTQKYFLEEMGINFRLENLLKSAMNNPKAKEEMIGGARMLTEEMGTRFKFMAIFGDNIFDGSNGHGEKAGQHSSYNNDVIVDYTKPAGF